MPRQVIGYQTDRIAIWARFLPAVGACSEGCGIPFHEPAVSMNKDRLQVV